MTLPILGRVFLCQFYFQKFSFDDYFSCFFMKLNAINVNQLNGIKIQIITNLEFTDKGLLLKNKKQDLITMPN